MPILGSKDITTDSPQNIAGPYICTEMISEDVSNAHYSDVTPTTVVNSPEFASPAQLGLLTQSMWETGRTL